MRGSSPPRIGVRLETEVIRGGGNDQLEWVVEVPVMPVVTPGAPESSTVPPVGGGPDPGSSAPTATTTGCGARLE